MMMADPRNVRPGAGPACGAGPRSGDAYPVASACAVKLPGDPPLLPSVSGPQAAALARGSTLRPPTPRSSRRGVSWDASATSVRRTSVQGRRGRACPSPSTVVFVLTNAGYEDDPPTVVAAIALYVRVDLKAKVLVDSDGVQVLEWHAPPGTSQVSIPNPAA